MRKFFTLASLFFIANVCVAQLTDGFSDGNFTINPVWSGNTSEFTVNPSNQLQLNNTVAGTSYLSTPFGIADLSQFDMEWQVYVKQTFQSSNNNFGRVYLVSDQADLTQPLNSYYLQFGENGSADAIELFRQSGTTRVSVCRATNGSIASSFAVRVKVLRSGSGMWQLFVDYTGGNTFTLDASGTDATHNVSSFTGIECVYSISNITKFFYDDFLIVSTPIPDTSSPTLQSVSVVDGSTLDLLFSESLNPIVSSTISNYSIDHSIGIPSGATLQSDNKTVRLSFTSSFKNGYPHQLSVSGIKDIAGNEITSLTKSFLYFVPTAAQAKDIIINEFFPDPSPVIGLPDQEFIEIYNRSNVPFDLAGWKLTDRSSIATFPSQIILPQEYWIVTSSSAAALFTPLGKTIGVSNFPTLNNSGDKIILLDPTGVTVDSLVYNLKWYNDVDKQQGGWTLELLNADTLRYDSANWLASLDATGGTPGKQNSQFGNKFDQTPPLWVGISTVNDHQLEIVTNEALDLTSLQTLSNFSSGLYGNPTSATLSVNKKIITLSFPNSFANGITDTLKVSGLIDLSGNLIVPSTKSFLYFLPSPLHPKDIIINEFLSDPTPIVGLPEAEYIELYNRSPNPIDLANWSLRDGSSSSSFSSKIIQPNEYWIVVSSSVAQQFSGLGNVISLSGFPSLNNSGDKILLFDPAAQMIDSLTYSLKWFSDADKQQGGWSLELLNSDTLRYDSANWLASLDVSGGTPGKENSQFGNKFDQTSPKWLNISTVNDRQLELVISEAIDATSVLNLNNYSSNLYGNPLAATLSSNKKNITLSFLNSFVNGVTDTLRVSGLIDLSGNPIFSSKKSFLYFQPSPIYTKDIVINEFMADPTPIVGLPEAEYIELYNRSSNPIDLANWGLSDGSSHSIFPSKIIKSNEYWIVVSASVAQQFAGLGNVIGLSGFPSLNNNGDKILLFDPRGQKIDSLTYSLKWFNDADKQQGGWSLELLNSDTLRYDSANWLPSIEVTGGTPGKKNSQNGKFFDQTPPNLISISAINQTQLQLLFSEKLEQSSAQGVLNYIINNQIGNPQIATLSADKKSVTLVFQSMFKNGISNSISVAGVSDLSGNILQSIQKDFLYFIPQPVSAKDIIITEIMADPAPVVGLPEAEYIEIYNRSSNAIDLLNWTLTDGSSGAKFPSKIIQPNEYWIVHSSASTQFNFYQNRIALSSFPSLNKSSDSIVLKSPASFTIDSVAYSVSWYRNSDKQDGGWSLEIIDPQNNCGEENNWAASENATGGTPGKQNSINANKPDLLGPKLLSVVVVQNNQLLLQFDEKLEKQISLTSFALSPDVAVTKVSFEDKSLREIKLELVQEFSNRQLYSIQINGLHDCSGNSIQEEFNTLSFALPEAGDSLDILVNEILFNPRPNGVDFIEIYNNSPKYINLKNWKLANIENGILKNHKEISSENFILSPFTYLALTEDAEIVKNNYPNNLTGNFLDFDLPSFPDDEGSVAIVNDEGKIIDQFIYSKNFHSSLLKDDEGVSLERISFLQDTQEQNNWQSASSISGFATPGYLNSNARAETTIDESSVLIEPEIFSSTSGQFTKINFRFDQSSFSANVKIFDQQGRLIKTIANNETLNNEGFFRWDGDQEDGSKARFGYYVIWFEIFDPSGFIKTFRKRVVVAGD